MAEIALAVALAALALRGIPGGDRDEALAPGAASSCEHGPEIPNADYQALGAEERGALLEALAPAPCPCGCTLGLLECALVDPICPSGRRLVSAAAWLATTGLRQVELAAATLAFERRVPALAEGVPAVGREVVVSLAGRPRLGPEPAALTIVVFADWRNPEAGELTVTMAALRRRYPDEVAFVLKSFPGDSGATRDLAAEALVEAQSQALGERAFERIVGRARPWHPDSLFEAAAAAGLDPDRLRAVLRSGRWRELVAEDYREAALARIGQAPTLVINGRLYQGGQGPNELGSVLEQVRRASVRTREGR